MNSPLPRHFFRGRRWAAVLAAGWVAAAPAAAYPPAQDDLQRILQLEDVFGLELATDPQISPDGSRVVYVRNSMDILVDRQRSRLWIVGADGSDHRALTAGESGGDERSPRWAPDGGRLAYVSSGALPEDRSAQIHVRWMDTGQTARLTQLPRPPSSLSWSPDGRWLAFSMLVPEPSPPYVELPDKPENASWAPAAKVIRKMIYRADGVGYLEDGYAQIFVVPAEGGSPRQLTSGPFHHRSRLSWTPDGANIVFSANRREDALKEPADSEVHQVGVADGEIRTLTSRLGPDESPAVSPDGERIAYLGYDDRYQGYQVTKLYVMNRDGSSPTVLTGSLDRDAALPQWNAEGDGLFFQYDDEGDTKVAFVPLDGEVEVRASGLGGTSLGRPYAGGSFSAAGNGSFAFTSGTTARPADVSVGPAGGPVTALNEDLLGHRELGETKEVWLESSFDGRRIQAWVVTPPGFDRSRKYPLILEIHGGPFTNYGSRFAAEVQLYAAAGYVVLYVNPRGSTSYGEEFGNLIHHAYPSQDFDDLMSAVDAVIAEGYVDEDNLFVTGGSGGGVLTSWIVGHTDRFAAAVAAKPVINWYSFVLTADAYGFFYRYWFPGFPWDHPEHYLERSPLHHVANVTTPTMLLTGEEDYRTPMSESEQFFQALQLLGIDSALVRIPGASHSIAARPSHLIAKVAHILRWFEDHRRE